MDVTLMLVDDEEMIRESVEAFFQAEGIGILTAAGGRECLDHLEAGFRGVILMDVMMPELDGWDTIRQIVAKKMYEGNIIVMLTAMNAPGTHMEGIQEYVTDYVTKPFDTDSLMESILYYQSLLKADNS